MVLAASLSDAAWNVDLLEVDAGAGYEFGLMASLDVHYVPIVGAIPEFLAIGSYLVGAKDRH